MSARVVDRPAGERAMRLALAGVIVFLAVAEGLEWKLSMGYGLSVKNALLYVLALALVMKFAVRHQFALEVGEIYACFAILIGYAIITMVVAAFVMEYPGYRPIASGIAVKTRLIDNAIFFAVFFFGLRDRANAHAMIRFLLFAGVFANSLAVLDALGFIQLGDMEQRDDGRVEGVIGESNMYGAYVAMLVPGILGAAVMTRGVRRIFWLTGLLVSSVALLLTVSRGAYVAIAVAAVWTAYLLRRHLSFGRIMVWGSATFGIVLVLLAIVSIWYGDLLTERLARSMAGDVETMSSGRTAIWMHAISRMLEAPISLVTGFGWHAYEAFPFRHSPHNYYLWLWFNLGVVGLIAGVLLYAFLVRRARDSVPYLDPEERPAMIGFVAGSIAFGVASFFVDLYSPWIWYSIYAGLAMRIAVSARSEAPLREVTPVAREQASQKRDPFGWVGSAR